MKGKVVELLGALLGLCLIGWGIMTLSTAGESCGSHSMSKGDRCTTITGNHSSSTRSQDEQASKDKRTGLFQLGFGVLITGACVCGRYSPTKNLHRRQLHRRRIHRSSGRRPTRPATELRLRVSRSPAQAG